MSDLLLGIDVGTSACKAAIVSIDGAELAHGQATTPWQRVPTGAQVEPEPLLRAVLAAAREAIAQAPDGRIAAIGVASVAESGMLVDADGAVLHPAIAWHDARGGPEAQALARELPEFSARTGLPATPLCTLAKLKHLDTQSPSATGTSDRRGARWLNVAEWIVARLGGREVAELSLASRTGLLDVHTRAPYADAHAWAGLPPDLLAELAVAGTDAGRSDGAALPGTAGAVLTVAGHDHLVAGVGAGVVAPGEVLDSCGTAEALVRVVAPALDEAATERSVAGGVTVGWHVAPDRQALLASLWSGLALGEVLDALGVERSGREDLDAGALAIAPGDAPALELDMRSLQRPPVRLPDAEPSAIWRAAIDATAREFDAVLAHIDAVAGAHTKVVVTGGWARDAAFRAAKGRLRGVEMPVVVEAGCRGAALLAGVAAGMYSSADDLPAVNERAKELA